MRKFLLLLLFPITLFSQGYTSYFTGNTTNITTSPEYGVCMMGGATEHDNAMIWLLEKANGGDVVVLRSSGSNGYNDYLYSELGVNVNSVETLVITSVAGATSPYVLDKVANAELIWFAGGDQYNYVSYFKDNALEDLLNNHINVKLAPIGGTSAGLAILGGKYFSAQNGSVTSAEALANPFNPYMTIGFDDFLHVPLLEDVITDSHYDDPDRRGRHTAFLARIRQLYINTKGIACNEYVAVCFGLDGLAYVYGDYPNYEEFAYFIQDNCNNNGDIETLQPNTPLTWDFAGKALQVYKVPGTMNGTHHFDLNNWESGSVSGGSWEYWSAVDGVMNFSAGIAPNCVLSTDEFSGLEMQVIPIPFNDFIQLSNAENADIKVFDIVGKCVIHITDYNGSEINTTSLDSGIYIMTAEVDGKTIPKKVVKN